MAIGQGPFWGGGAEPKRPSAAPPEPAALEVPEGGGMTGPVSREAVREFITAIVAQAKAALDGAKNPGFLQMSWLHPESEKLVPSRYSLDDVDVVERMVHDAIATCENGHNVYIEGRTIRSDAALGSGRGKLEDTAYVFAQVVDSDADTGKGWKPNGTASPSMTVETSPGNFQFWFFFSKAIEADVGKSLGERLRTATGADHDTGTVAQPYRVAGTVNYPNKKKIERGRVTVATRIVEFTEELWTRERLEEVFPLPESKTNGDGGGGGNDGAQPDEGNIPADTMRVIRDGPSASASNRDRSQTFWNVTVALKRLGFTVEGIVDLLERHPDGIAKKYEGRLRQEVERDYKKIREQPGPAEAMLQSVCASTVTMKALDWLWPNRFAIGKLGLLVGLPDEGKGQILCDIAARVTTGTGWPCDEGAAPIGNVIILTAEDSIHDTVVPRLAAAGAKLDRVHFITMVREDGKDRMFNLASDLQALRRKIKEVGDVRLVEIDPVSAYLGVGKVDSYRTTDVRAVLSPLTDLADEVGTAVVGIMHFNKKVDITNALLRVSDSLAFGAAARHVYGVVNDPENKRKLLVRAKNNLSSVTTDKTLAYRFGAREVGNDPKSGKEIWAPHVIWETRHVDVTAAEALQAAADNRSPTARDEAKKFLAEILASGPVAKTEIEEAAEGNGIAERTLFRAKAELKIIAKRDGSDGSWTWRLPDAPKQEWHDD
jgi:hypothetical protein